MSKDKYFSQHAHTWFWNSGNITWIFPSFSWGTSVIWQHIWWMISLHRYVYGGNKRILLLENDSVLHRRIIPKYSSSSIQFHRLKDCVFISQWMWLIFPMSKFCWYFFPSRERFPSRSFICCWMRGHVFSILTLTRLVLIRVLFSVCNS